MDTLVELLVVVLIFGILYWAITQIPLPKIARVVANVILAIVLVIVLLSFLGWGVPPTWRWHHRPW